VPPLEESRPCLLLGWSGEDSYTERRQLRHRGVFRAVHPSEALRKYRRAHAAWAG
jgi:hypothetical protein